MKKALILFAAALLLAGCCNNSKSDNHTRPKLREVIFFRMEHQGHTYVVAEAYGGLVAASYAMSIAHDPDCLCHQTTNTTQP